jgi:hypothetical protein
MPKYFPKVVKNGFRHIQTPKTGAHDRNRTDDLVLTKDALYPTELRGRQKKMERETGFEPATLSLEG